MNITLEQGASATFYDIHDNDVVNIGSINGEGTIETEKQKIDEELLASFFKAGFKGIGKGVDYFHEYLLLDLKKSRTAKDFAMIAKIIYDSEQLAIKRATFKLWYESFCKAIGIECSQYRPYLLETMPTELKKEFSYLF